MLHAIFWSCLAIGAYPYVIYPALARLLARIISRQIESAEITPRVSILISAYNEAAHIEGTIRNKLEQDYRGELELLVASDGSIDATDAIVQRLVANDARVRFLRLSKRQGKTAALNRLTALATGDILIFSDANSMYRPDTVRHLVSNFADSSVGYVTGKMIYVNSEGSLTGDGCSSYMRYENWLRLVENKLGSVVGVDGGVDAIRRTLYCNMREDQLPDFILPLRVVEQGRRAVYDPSAILLEDTLNEQAAEFRMRVRVSLRALWALREMRSMLLGRSGTLFAWQLWSHKVLRYLSFLPLTIASVTCALLAPSSIEYEALLALQICFWAAALLASMGVRWAPVRFCQYFVLLNAASAIAFIKFLRGKRIVTWQPRLG